MIAGISKIRTTVSGKELPSPRLIGNLLVDPSFENRYDSELSVDTNNIMGLMFGQLLTHDSTDRLVYHVQGGVNIRIISRTFFDVINSYFRWQRRISMLQIRQFRSVETRTYESQLHSR